MLRAGLDLSQVSTHCSLGNPTRQANFTGGETEAQGETALSNIRSRAGQARALCPSQGSVPQPLTCGSCERRESTVNNINSSNNNEDKVAATSPESAC